MHQASGFPLITYFTVVELQSFPSLTVSISHICAKYKRPNVMGIRLGLHNNMGIMGVGKTKIVEVKNLT